MRSTASSAGEGRAEAGLTLVTGAAGFIGGACAGSLMEKGHRVAALVHRSPLHADPARESKLAAVLRASLTDEDALRREMEKTCASADLPIDTVVHCAAFASDVGPAALFRRVNFEGTQALVRAARPLGLRRFVFLSTTDVYGLHDFENAGEDTPFDDGARHPYPRFKIAAERWLRETLPPDALAILRPAAVWGPGDTTLLPRFLGFLRNSPAVIHFGRWRGENRWPLAHIRNVCRAADLAARVEGSVTWNVVDSEVTTVDGFHRMLLETFFPRRRGLRRVTVPVPLAAMVAGAGTLLARALHRRAPLWDPTLYALRSVSRNLDFSNERLRKAFAEHGMELVSRAEGLEELRRWAEREGLIPASAEPLLPGSVREERRGP